MELVKFLEKSRTSHSNQSGHIEDDIMSTMSKKKELKKMVRTQD
jgi:hypothetical protein